MFNPQQFKNENMIAGIVADIPTLALDSTIPYRHPHTFAIDWHQFSIQGIT